MKLPTSRPGSNAFMVFSMLLLGVFAAALLLIFDYWFGTDRSLSTILLLKLHDPKLPLLWITAVGGLTLMAFGFFFYLLSFFLLAAPAFSGRALVRQILPKDDDLFFNLSGIALARFLPQEIANRQSRKYRDAFLYLLLTSVDTQTASAARFSFTQIMYARSLGTVFIAFAIYTSWVLYLPILTSVAIVLLTWISVCVLYAIGLSFYETIMTSGVLIERLHLDTAEPKPKTKIRSAKSAEKGIARTEA
ncbi:MAG: hypothetical protein Q7U28_06455 [Aquabacterium sp.]|nr:hypothetical protein [Aquabacterium sp.]